LQAKSFKGFTYVWFCRDLSSGNPKPVDPARVERMCDAIAHRGPDGFGVWTAPGIGMGHRRLSIIDIAGSPQPMASTDGRAMLLFNGEIYNYRDCAPNWRRRGGFPQTATAR
jgi:asparagine synthase (glutamine-hydrolysing)